MATLKTKYGTEEEVNLGSTGSITAFAGGGQGSATALTKKWNEVTTCATEFDSVKLMGAKIGSKQVVFNNTLNTLSVFPVSGESINGVADYQFNIQAGGVMTFESQKNGRWFSYGGSI
jgi:hypothetical protein